MVAEQNKTECNRWRDELLRLACGDVTVLPPTLLEHTAACPACREMLESSRQVLAEARLALEPEPLPAALAARIRDRLDTVKPGRRPMPSWIRLTAAGAAVAACILMTIMAPRGLQPAARTPTGEVALSADDAAAIAAAYAVLRWDDPTEYALETLADRTNEVTQSLERKPESRSLLPWSPQDDWDVPAARSESSRSDPGRTVWAGDQARRLATRES